MSDTEKQIIDTRPSEEWYKKQIQKLRNENYTLRDTVKELVEVLHNMVTIGEEE